MNQDMSQNVKPKWWQGKLFYILILVAVLALAFAFLPPTNRPKKVDLYTFIEQVKEGKVDTIKQDENTIVGLKNNEEKIESGFIGGTNELINTLEKAGVTIGENGITLKVEARKFDWASLAISFIPLLLFGALLFFVFRSYRKKTG